MLKIEYVVTGPTETIVLPVGALPERQDGLWRHTCFEAFFALQDGAYVEFNLSPSRCYASYRFAGYRDGMQPALDLAAPDIHTELSGSRYALTARVDRKPFAALGSGRLGLSAVIEATDRSRSYWALAHAAGPPDFHDPATFVAALPLPTD